MTDSHFPQPARAATVAWLNAILAERLSGQLRLSQPAPGHLLLSLPGSDVGIRIESDYATFSQACSDLPCSHWD
ncbi:MAG: hypothetical protein ACTS5Y_08320, partial [Pollutimonas bauzanensis]